MQTNKGVYALLLGSGVSRAAQIPTGWEVVCDLVKKIAQMQGVDCSSDPAKWYQEKYQKEPDYSELLDELAKSPEERQKLLSAYFEPNEEEREQGLKQPTSAHRAIANLVEGGFVRVIVTTNFDRLTELAIEEVGITPTVLSTPDAIMGSLPLIHQECVIIKVHGDYKDTRIKNTFGELSEYAKSVDELLDRIVDEFGFVFCGWSAQWDPALYKAFERSRNRRFTSYWASRGKPSEKAQKLLNSRAGEYIQIKDAESFFNELAEKVISLEEFQKPHPLSVASAAATIKRLLSDDKHIIRLHDLVHEEKEKAYSAIQLVLYSLFKRANTEEENQKAISELQSSLELLRTICVYGAYWGRAQHQDIFSKVVQRLCNEPAGKDNSNWNGRQIMPSLRAIPSLVLLYTMGIAAIANRNFDMLTTILIRPQSSHSGRQPRNLLLNIDWCEFQDWIKGIPEHKNDYFPASEWLFKECRSVLAPMISDDQEYERCFDIFEMTYSLINLDLGCGSQFDLEREAVSFPPGRYIRIYYRMKDYQQGDYLELLNVKEKLAQPFLKAGLFAGKEEVFHIALEVFKKGIMKKAYYYHL
ncbi:SIR2 family protein [Gimesia sp.]|uniref:SIR2 family protein n=1 Tax=Gimesia sp. TaxID=2024833 RepID=UPI0025C20FCA|nr:SIR2 family protein [Gimesia sp.]